MFMLRKEFTPGWSLPLINNLHCPRDLEVHHTQTRFLLQQPRCCVRLLCVLCPSSLILNSIPDFHKWTMTLHSFIQLWPPIELWLPTGQPHTDAQWMFQTNTGKATVYSPTLSTSTPSPILFSPPTQANVTQGPLLKISQFFSSI